MRGRFESTGQRCRAVVDELLGHLVCWIVQQIEGGHSQGTILQVMPSWRVPMPVLFAAGQVDFKTGQTWLACGAGSDRLLMYRGPNWPLHIAKLKI